MVKVKHISPGILHRQEVSAWRALNFSPPGFTNSISQKQSDAISMGIANPVNIAYCGFLQI